MLNSQKSTIKLNSGKNWYTNIVNNNKLKVFVAEQYNAAHSHVGVHSIKYEIEMYEKVEILRRSNLF